MNRKGKTERERDREKAKQTERDSKKICKILKNKRESYDRKWMISMHIIKGTDYLYHGNYIRYGNSEYVAHI